MSVYSKQVRAMRYENRINLLTSRGPQNAKLIAKLQRNLRNLQK